MKEICFVPRQAGQLPPQSIPVSSPFCIPFEQQSIGQLPPQSISVSSPFCFPSVQQLSEHFPPQSTPISSWFCFPSLQVSVQIQRFMHQKNQICYNKVNGFSFFLLNFSTPCASEDIIIGWTVIDVVFTISIWQDLISLTKLIITHAN